MRLRFELIVLVYLLLPFLLGLDETFRYLCLVALCLLGEPWLVMCLLQILLSCFIVHVY